MLLFGKVIVVTGGAGLIGQYFCRAIMKEGGIPVIADIDEHSMRVVSEDLSRTFPDGKLEVFKLDITSKYSLQKCIEYLDNKYRKIDALVNNAYPRNKNYGRHFFDVEYDDFVENLGANLGGCVVSLFYALATGLLLV